MCLLAGPGQYRRWRANCTRTTKNDRNRKTPARLPTVAELFPEIVTPLLDNTADLSACGAVEALERQEPFINQTLAYQALAILARSSTTAS